ELLSADFEVVDDFLISKWATEIRSRFLRAFGLTLPRILFRPLRESYPEGTYRISYPEVVVEEGSLEKSGDHYSQSWQELLMQTLSKLESWLIRNMPQLLQVQEVQGLVGQHCGEWYHELATDDFSHIETHAHIGPLTSVVKSLAAERTPLIEFTRIY